MRLFGATSATFQFVGERLHVVSGNKDTHRVLTESLADEAAFQEGIVFARLVLHTASGRRTFSGLRKKEAVELLQWLREHWLRQLAPEVVKTAENIRVLLSQGYPRQSRLEVARAIAQQALARFVRVPEPEWCRDLQDVPFKRVALVARWQDADLEKLRQSYASRQLQIYADFFDSVESKPLTERQRKACVVDEDNNLVLAGAGTGKTSVMVGVRVIYSKAVRPRPVTFLCWHLPTRRRQRCRSASSSGWGSAELLPALSTSWAKRSLPK
jgi:DNA helicase-4